MAASTWLLKDQERIPSDFRPSTGPEATWAEVADAAFKEQNLNYAVYGMQWEILDRMEKAREKNSNLPGFARDEMTEIMKAVSEGRPLSEVQDIQDRALTGTSPSDWDRPIQERIAEFEKTSGQSISTIVGDVFKEAKRRDNEMNLVGSRAGLFKNIVAGIGGTGAAMLDAERDPTNFWTLGVGGFGRTVLSRIGTEGLTQSGIEGLNFALGAKRNRDLAGLDTSAGHIATQMAVTGVAGSALRGGFEGLGAGFRRLTGPKPPEPKIQPTKRVDAAPTDEPKSPQFMDTDSVWSVDLNEGRGMGIENVTRRSDDVEITQTSATIEARVREMEDFAASYRETTARMYTQSQSTPVQIETPVRVDYSWKARAMDDADIFSGQTSPAEALINIEVPTPDGTMARPFRVFSGEAVDDMAINDMILEANPALTRLRASLTTKIDRIEAMVSEKQDAAGIKESAELGEQIARLQTELAKNMHPKKRVRDLVRQDIAELQARKDVLDKQLKDVSPEVKYLQERLAELRGERGLVDSEIAHMTRQVVEDAQSSVPTPLPIDPVFGRVFMPTEANIIKFSEQMDKVIKEVEAAEEVRIKDLVNNMKEAVLDNEVAKIDIGDIKNVDLDMEFIVDVSDDGKSVQTMTVRDYVKTLDKDDNLIEAMQTCSIGGP